MDTVSLSKPVGDSSADNDNVRPSTSHLTTPSVAEKSTSPSDPAQTQHLTVIKEKEKDQGQDMTTYSHDGASQPVTESQVGADRLNRPSKSRFKMQNRPAHLIRNLHANYFNRPMVDKAREAPPTSAVGSTVQGIRGHVFACGAAVSLTGCVLFLCQGCLNQTWIPSHIAYHSLFAAACSWQWLRVKAVSVPFDDDSIKSPRNTESDDDSTLAPTEAQPPASHLHYWAFGYGLLGVLGNAVISSGELAAPMYPVSFLAACSPTIVGVVLLGLEKISQALALDQKKFTTEKEMLQEEHELMMDAYKDENLYRKNVLLETVGKEVQDAATLAIETLGQMTPANLFPPNVAHEQLSPCTLPIPITSVLGLFTTMRHLQYVSRNMERLSRVMFSEYVQGIVEKTSPHYHKGETGFDVGEFVQSLGDLVSADASLKGVEFVIYHSEYDLNHVSIKGSEESWRHALINLIKSIIDCAKAGSTVELCLSLFTVSQREETKNKVLVSFDITYYPNPESAVIEDDLARLNALLASKLVKAMGGTLTIDQLDKFVKKFIITVEVSKQDEKVIQSKAQDITPPSVHPLEPTKTVSHAVKSPIVDENLQSSDSGYVSLPAATDASHQQYFQQHTKTPLVSPSPSPSSPTPRRLGHNSRISTEPTINELVRFTRKLSGLKVLLLAKEHSAFASRLTGYLKAWDIVVNRISISESDVSDSRDTQTQDELHSLSGAKRTSSSSSLSSKHIPTKPETSSPLAKPQTMPAFIMIDDDIKALGQQILKMQANPPIPSPSAPRRATHRRLKSVSNIQQTSIIYFTSLPTFKLARETVVQLVSAQVPGVGFGLGSTNSGTGLGYGSPPCILILPKPAGPRRILTAMHTAVHSPVLDQTYSPIATAPTSPAPAMRHFSEEINPLDRDQVVIDPVSNQAYARTTPQSTQSSPGGGSSPNSHLSDHHRHGRDLVRQSIEAAGRAAGQVVHPFVQSPLDSQSPESPDSINMMVGSPTGILVPASGKQPSGIQFDPLARPSGTLSPSLVGPSQRRVSGGSGRLLGHSYSNEGIVFVPPIAGAGGQQPFSLTPTRQSDLALASANMIRFNGGHQHMRLGAGSPLATPPAITQASGGPFSPPMMRPSGMNSPLPQRPEQVAMRETSGGPLASGHSDKSMSPKPMHGATSPMSPSHVSPGIAAGQPINSGGQPPIAVATGPDQTGSSGARLRGLSSVKKTKDGKDKKASAKSNVVERVSPLVNVLIVEDNPVNQAILVKFMKTRKIKCDVACNGREAVDKWKTGGFHLVLMDLQMEVMDGIEATREIRRLEREQNIGVFPTHNAMPTSGTTTSNPSASASGVATSPPASPFRSPVVIVALTATAESEDVRNTALVAGCNDYVTKPINLQWLENRIVDWGCMQALIDVDAWKKWKKDMEGASPGSTGLSMNPPSLKKTLSGSVSRASLKRPSISSRSIKKSSSTSTGKSPAPGTPASTLSPNPAAGSTTSAAE
ncbi:ssk1 response regulator receiver [Podila epigama]|nr:ssk1 response regulator receiver [Podila epigama]